MFEDFNRSFFLFRMLQASLGEALEDGRAKWILEKGGKRFKLQTADNNEVHLEVIGGYASKDNGLGMRTLSVRM